MLKLAMALVALTPAAALAGQASAQLSVGIVITGVATDPHRPAAAPKPPLVGPAAQQKPGATVPPGADSGSGGAAHP